MRSLGNSCSFLGRGGELSFCLLTLPAAWQPITSSYTQSLTVLKQNNVENVTQHSFQNFSFSGMFSYGSLCSFLTTGNNNQIIYRLYKAKMKNKTLPFLGLFSFCFLFCSILICFLNLIVYYYPRYLSVF